MSWFDEFMEGAKSDYDIGRDDLARRYYRQRDLEGKGDDAAKFESMRNTHPGVIRAREALGQISPEAKQSLKEQGMDLRGSLPHKVGQFAGTAAADLTQDYSRSIWWLLNAMQATGEVINEEALNMAVPELRGASPVNLPGVKTKVDGELVDKQLSMRDPASLQHMAEKGITRMQDDKPVLNRGFKADDKGNVYTRNYGQGRLASLAIPTGVAINSGLGLLTPFGGAEGYMAALPSKEDPTKTQNVLGEVALKYIVGRTGNLLPYDEFSKVRPDVSRDEYNRYQAFKYDKNTDLNPMDGDITLPGGILKATTEGIHGPEVQFLGRSLPVTTGVVPFLASMAGGLAGAKIGQKRRYTDQYGIDRGNAVLGGFTGGMAGLVAGQVGGNIIENERRRRNSVENQLEGGNAEQYLR